MPALQRLLQRGGKRWSDGYTVLRALYLAA